MKHDEVRKKLKQYGYTQKREVLSEFSNKNIIRRTFSDKSLNHTNLWNSCISGANFDNAALTGSYFSKCHFRHCRMDKSDFEYCEFNNCYFTSKHTVISSFNESNFLETHFKNIEFSGCAFSGSLFEKCTFEKTKFEFTTFENSLFRNCSFQDMNMSILNFDYVEFENPKMKNVVLPLEQITHAIGLLEYCKFTDDNIFLGSDSPPILSKEEYWKDVIPLLEEEYIYLNEYFPLSNIYLARGEYEKANHTLHQGLCVAAANHDFRMIKFYCKLIKKNPCFDSHALHNFYHSICRLSPNPSVVENNSLLKGYIRNIGEIKNILFDSTRKPMFHMSILTNLSSGQNSHIGKLISKLFKITKMEHVNIPNVTSIKITENSPILIDLEIIGEEDNLANLFPILLTLSNTKEIPLLDTNTQRSSQLEKQAKQCYSFCIDLGITLTLVEYYFENCIKIIPANKNIYYYNSNLGQYRNYLDGL